MFKRLKAQAKRIIDNRLPFEILEEFSLFEQKYLEEKGTLFPVVNGNKVIIDYKMKQAAKISLSIAVVFFIFMFIGGAVSNEGLGHPVAIILLSISFLVAIYYSHEIYINRHEVITLDRENGLISFPVGLRKNKRGTSPFDKINIHWTTTGASTGNIKIHLVASHPHIKGGTFLEGLDTNHRKNWSFYVWYMDKNRPLPPGSAFDPYREADFERRKAEGFRRPLYPSFVSTPEATPEQQAERDKHWKENIEYFQCEHNSRWYNPRKDTDWKTAKYGLGKDLRTPMANECLKYTFEDGTIVYAKTNHKGEVPEPPATAKYIINKVEVVKN